MCYEATRDLLTCEIEIETPLTKMKSRVIAGRKLAFVQYSERGWEWWTVELVPAAKVGHIGLYRDPKP